MAAAILETGLRIFGRRSPNEPQGPSATPSGDLAKNARLERLVAKARAVLLFERSWRLLAPPLIVIGFFICLSWTGLWLEIPHWARAPGLGAFVLGLGISLLPLRHFRFPTRKEALDRIDRVSGFKERPAAVLEDRLGNPGNDPATQALWSLHRRRAEKAVALLRAGLPSPRVVDIDPHALRAAVLVGLVATSFIAGPEKYARVAAAFDWRFGGLAGPGRRIDAWVDPPTYTGRAPIILSDGSSPQRIEAPAGSMVIIRSSGGRAIYHAEGALEEAPSQAAADKQSGAAGISGAPPSESRAGRAESGETHLILRGDANLTIDSIGGFQFAAIADRPPTIALTDPPKANVRGTLTLNYQISDDYGAVSSEAVFANPALPGGALAKRSLVDPPKAALQLPPIGSETGEAETTIDLSDHPWAGVRVEMTLVARDEGGNEGKSDPVTIALPQKPFVKPLARALVEQRRNLILAPDDKERVAAALAVLMIEPDAFGVGDGVYLGFHVAAERLAAANKDSDLVDVAEFLWQMALRIENGDLSEAERDLRAAQQQLREALQRGAPPEELKRLTDNLRAAMDKFLRELAEQQQKEMDQANQGADKNQSRAKSISPKQLEAMLDKMQSLAQSGDAGDAQKMLDQMQNILENLKMARRRNADPRSQDMSRALSQLGQMGKDQQDLRDDTYQNGQSAKRQQRRQHSRMDGQDEAPQADNSLTGGDAQQNGDVDDQAEENGVPESGHSQDELEKRQQELANRLEELEKRLKKAGQGDAGLGQAEKAMREAQKALQDGAGSRDSAVEAQGRALNGLREGAKKLAQAMRQQGEGEGEGEGQGEGENEAEGPGGEFGQNGTDPLGRPTGRERAFNPSAKYDPMGVPAAERAQRVLEELRRRLGEPSRPREEMDYFERLLRRY
jgi:uncharacterized protein (TIGR02302 family)